MWKLALSSHRPYRIMEVRSNTLLVGPVDVAGQSDVICCRAAKEVVAWVQVEVSKEEEALGRRKKQTLITSTYSDPRTESDSRGRELEGRGVMY